MTMLNDTAYFQFLNSFWQGANERVPKRLTEPSVLPKVNIAAISYCFPRARIKKGEVFLNASEGVGFI